MSDPIVPTKTDFVLDDRDAKRLLQELQQYSQALPPVSIDPQDNGKRDNTWDTVLFGPAEKENKKESHAAVLHNLARLASDPGLADGQLPVAQTVVLAMLKLLETPKRLLNQLPEWLRDLYYRRYLGMAERAARPDRVMLSAVLEDSYTELVLKAGTAFDGGQDSEGTARVYRLDQTCTVNRARCTDLRWYTGPLNARVARVVYDETAGQTWPDGGVRLFAPAPKRILPEPRPDDDRLVGGRLVTLVKLNPPGDKTSPELVVTFESGVDSARLRAAISAGDHWVEGKDPKPDSKDPKKITFSFDQVDLKPAAASNLDGLTTSVPVVRLSMTDGKAVPEVTSISCIAPRAGEITYTEEAFEQWAPMLPFDYAQLSDATFAGNELYIGIQSVEPDQLLSLHWQLRSPQSLAFDECAYLAWDAQDGHWEPLGDALIDSTNGWRESGVWSLSWPKDALDTARVAKPARQRMPPGRYWLRLHVKLPVPDPEQAASMLVYPWARGLHTNALSATLAEPETIAATHFKKPLPAGKITAAVDSLDGLRSVIQPWPSEGGQPPETRAAWIERVSARLRHRERALNDWDIKRLLRDQYVGIRDLHLFEPHVTRALRHRAHRIIALMPNESTRDNDDPLRPAFSQTHLDEMREWLAQRASPWLRITFCNPNYVPVQVICSVDFKPGISRALGNQQIRQALHARYLDWSTNDAPKRLIGRDLEYHDVMQVIQACDAVQRIDSLKLNGREDSVKAEDTEVLVPVIAAHKSARLGIAFEEPPKENECEEPSKEDDRQLIVTDGKPKILHWQRAVIYGNGRNQVKVKCALPKKLTFASAAPIDIQDGMVFLYDCDTGERLDKSGTRAGLSFTNKKGSYCQAVRVEGEREIESECEKLLKESGLMPWSRYVQANQAVGSYRIGVGVDATLPGGRIEKLRSHEGGLELSLQVLPKVDYSQPENWEIKTLPHVPLTVSPDAQVSVTLGTYVLQPKASSIVPIQPELELKLPSALGADRLEKAWGKGTIKLLNNDAPHAITASKDAIHVWWVEPEPEPELKPESLNIKPPTETSPKPEPKKYGIEKGSCIEVPSGGKSEQAEIHKFLFGSRDIVFSPVPRRKPARSLTIYGLHIRQSSSSEPQTFGRGIEAQQSLDFGKGIKRQQPLDLLKKGIAAVADPYGNEGNAPLLIQKDRPKVDSHDNA